MKRKVKFKNCQPLRSLERAENALLFVRRSPSLVRNLFLFFFIPTILACAPAGPPQFPTDSEMINHLESNFSEFENLLLMFEKDGMSVVHPSWVQPKNKISEARLAEYRDIFVRLELDGGLRSWGGESVRLISHSSGFVFGGSEKGFMYKPENPSPLYESLDIPPEDLLSNVSAYRYVKKNWYLEYRWDD